MSSIDDLRVADDRLEGAEQIASFRGEAVSRTRYLIRIRAIPFYREGTRIIASKRILREHHLQQASRGMLADQQEAAE